MAPQPQTSAASSGPPKARCGPQGDHGPQYGTSGLDNMHYFLTFRFMVVLLGLSVHQCIMEFHGQFQV